MKLLLINAGKDLIALSCEPIGLEYLGAYAEERGVDVRIINMAQVEVEKYVKKWDPDFVGFTATTPTVNCAYESSDKLRQLGYKTIIGGIHASIMPEEAIKHFDWVVVGDGEEALMEIINGKAEKGILRPPWIMDITKLPFPARHLVDMNYFFSAIGHRWPFGGKESWVPLFTARGCPYKCMFCYNSKRPIPPRYNSVDRVIEEIKFIQKEFKINNLFIHDDDFFLPPKRFRELAERMIPLNVKWMANARVTSLTDELAELAVKSGCRFLAIGFESNSDKCLKTLHKGSTHEDNQRAADICKKHGIKVLANTMIGIPGELPEDIEKTIDFVKRNKFFFTGLCVATPLPGTKLWDYSEENGLLPETFKWDDFLIGNPRLKISANKEMTREETMKYFKILDNLIESQKTRLDIGWMFSLFWNNPMSSLRTIWAYRKRITKYLGRIG